MKLLKVLEMRGLMEEMVIHVRINAERHENAPAFNLYFCKPCPASPNIMSAFTRKGICSLPVYKAIAPIID